MMLLLVMMTMMMTILIEICLFGTLLDSYLFNPFLRCRIRYEMNIFNIIHHCYNQSWLPRTIIRIDSIMHFKATIPSLSIHLYDSIISKLQFHHFQYIYTCMVYTHTFICIRITQFELFKPHPWLTRWNHPSTIA
jgi:hypothetical protein